MTAPQAVSSVALVKIKVENPAEPVSLPPAEFYDSITSSKVADSPSCCFILYCMNKVQLEVEVENGNDNPFELFKDCYKRIKRMRRGQQLQRYFSVSSLRSPLAQDLGDPWDGTTVLKSESDGQVPAASEMSIYPQILRFHRFNSPIDTEKHLKAYLIRFQLVLEKFSSGNLCQLYVNWLKLIESYVELVFRDLIVKWCQYLHSIRAAGQRRSMKASLETLLPKICNRFWRLYFAFHHCIRKSIGSLTTLLSRRAATLNPKSHQKTGSKTTFGLWLDSINGILIFGNGIVSPAADADSQGAHVAPVCGICLDTVAPDTTTKRLILFLNFAIVECFINEID
ncbi:hypothetical protein HG536_0D05030 [Torulaspora globosa]|uniref:Uncharacterized protein n=1 Tax=Torulaspora globosa TaxID=48254 RepID=A0A7G3ZHJ5_9SACH|nr:uncharacterized protein HG536_0D05030 [Torulaspora globosa]QLL32981.1 hypothetical protein HG536_0D05030 [Torulaspora globosa]